MSAELFADPERLNSLLRTERTIFIQKKTHDEPEQSNTQTITSKIGDLIKNTATCHVTMEKDTFVVGEPLKVLIDLDNSKVTKKVKSYKFKL